MGFWRSARSTHAASGSAWQLVTLEQGRRAFPDWLLTVGERVVFSAQDGTSGQLYAAAPSDAPSPVETLTAFDHFVVVTAHGAREARSVWATHRDGLWASDGTRHGTHCIAAPHLVADVRALVPCGNAWLFDAAYPAAAGRALWRTDGTPDGTCMLHGFGRDPHAIARVVSHGDHVAFVGGQRLWLAADSRTPPVKVLGFGVVDQVTPIAVTSRGVLAWRIADGVVTLLLCAPSGVTELLRAPRESTSSAWLTGATRAPDGSLWFTVPRSLDTPSLTGVWRLEGDVAQHVSAAPASELAFVGTTVLAAQSSGLFLLDGDELCAGNVSNLTVAGAWLWFSEGTRSAGWRLWRTDGVRTERVHDFARDPRLGMNAFPLSRPLLPIGDRVVFAASATDQDLQLWAAR